MDILSACLPHHHGATAPLAFLSEYNIRTSLLILYLSLLLLAHEQYLVRRIYARYACGSVAKIFLGA